MNTNKFFKIKNIVLASSGADLEILKKCPKYEVHQYFALGMNVLITAFLSSLAFGSLFYNFIDISVAL